MNCRLRIKVHDFIFFLFEKKKKMINRFANKSKTVDGQLFKILKVPWDLMPIGETNGFHLMMWTLFAANPILYAQ